MMKVMLNILNVKECDRRHVRVSGQSKPDILSGKVKRMMSMIVLAVVFKMWPLVIIILGIIIIIILCHVYCQQ